MSSWTNDEVEILKTYYGRIPVREIRQLYLRNRTEGAIRGKASRLILRSTLTVKPTKIVEEKVTIVKDVTAAKDQELLEELGRRGYLSVKQRIPKLDMTYKLPVQKTFEIGIVSDSHLGSKYQQLTHLTHFYDLCAKRGIKIILNGGDVTEGNGKQYRGQIYEMFLHGADAQVDYVTKGYPKSDGITTYMIGGQHDESFWKTDGQDVLGRIAEKRNDIKYLGFYGAYINFGDIKTYLMHGHGGVAYARSYKLQKIIEQMAPQRKPHLLFVGHWHVANHLPMYRNVEGFQLGCFQAQTPYMRKKGIYPTTAGLIVKVHTNAKGIAGIDTHWEYYYEPIEHDY